MWTRKLAALKRCSTHMENYPCSEIISLDISSETFVQFESLFARAISDFPSDKVRARDLRRIIDSTATSVKEKHRGTDEKSVVRKLVKTLVKDAEHSYSSIEMVTKQEAVFKHFAGIPESTIEGCPFMFLKTGVSETSIFSFGSGFNREYLAKLTPRPNRGIILTRDGRKELDLENLQVDTFSMEPAHETGALEISQPQPIIDALATTQGLVLEPLVPSGGVETRYLGWTLTTERQPFVWGTKKSQVTGFLKKELPLKEEDLLAAHDLQHNPGKTHGLR